MRPISRIYTILLIIELLSIGTLFFNREFLTKDPRDIKTNFIRTWGGEGKDYAEGLTLDGNFLYVVGTKDSLGDARLVLLKYNLTGNLEWAMTTNGTEETMGRGVASRQGALYAAGIKFVNDKPKAFLIKFTSQGNIIWETEWNNFGDAVARGVTVDDQDNIWVAGYFYSSPLKTTGMLLKFSPEGKLLRELELGTGKGVVCWGLSAGNVIYVVGSEDEAGKEKPVALEPNKFDALIWKLSLEGSLEWEKRWGSGFYNYAIAVQYTNAGPVIAGWTRFMNGTARMMLITYSKTGNLLSEGLYGDSWTEDIAWSVAKSGDFTFIAGHYQNSLLFNDNVAVIYKIGKDGNILWWAPYGGQRADSVKGIVVNGDKIYIAGESETNIPNSKIFLIAYESPNSPPGSNLIKITLSFPIIFGIVILVINIVELFRKVSIRQINNEA